MGDSGVLRGGTCHEERQSSDSPVHFIDYITARQGDSVRFGLVFAEARGAFSEAVRPGFAPRRAMPDSGLHDVWTDRQEPIAGAIHESSARAPCQQRC